MFHVIVLGGMSLVACGGIATSSGGSVDGSAEAAVDGYPFEGRHPEDAFPSESDTVLDAGPEGFPSETDPMPDVQHFPVTAPVPPHDAGCIDVRDGFPDETDLQPCDAGPRADAKIDAFPMEA
jgi:hypothetical protein